MKNQVRPATIEQLAWRAPLDNTLQDLLPVYSEGDPDLRASESG